MRSGLYALVDVDSLAGRDPLRFAEKLLAAGPLAAVQLRAKHLATAPMLELARALAWRCSRAAVPFFVNDRADVAWLAGATGVHLGQRDLPPERLASVAPGLSVGLSTHEEAQLEAALALGEAGISLAYVALGPIFETHSKEKPDPTVGLERLGRAASRAGSVPLVAIGGLSLERAPAVRAAGARAGAVISALAQVPEEKLTETARALHLALGGA